MNQEHSRGVTYITLQDEEITAFYQNSLNVADLDLKQNDYAIFLVDGEIIGKKKVSKNLDLQELNYARIYSDKFFKPLNVLQECAFDLMIDPNIKIKVMTGLAGSGKTKLALHFGFEKLAKQDVEKILIVRNPVAVGGEEVGFFRGTKTDKLMHWNRNIQDNLEGMATLEELIDKKQVEIEVPYLMKGRDLKNCFIIVDEAEDLTEDIFKMLGERVSSGSYITFVGDIKQVSKDKYAKNNGLNRIFNLRGCPIFGAVELKDDVRSDVSHIFATIY